MAGLDDDGCAVAAFFLRNCSKDGPFLPSGSSGGMNLLMKSSFYSGLLMTMVMTMFLNLSFRAKVDY